MARDFDGVNQLLYCATAPITTVPLSMACWFNSDSITIQQFLLALVNYTGGSGGGFWALTANGDVAGDPVHATTYQTGGTTRFASSTSGYAANVWHHICGVFSANNARAVYLDGGNKGTDANASTPANVTYFSIGTLYRTDNPGVYTNGRIAEAAIWNVALTDDEAAILAKGISPLSVRPVSLFGYWPLIGKYNPEIDRINGNSLSLANAPVAAAHPRIFYLAKSFLSVYDINLPPNAPTALTALAISSTQIDLAWTDNSGDETGFSIARSTDGVNFAEIDTVVANEESYSDTTCIPNTLYYYKVCAYNGSGNSAYTNIASAKTPPDSMVIYQYLSLDGGQIIRTDGRYLALVDGVPEPDTVAGCAWIYVDEDDGDLKAKFGDGTVKTIVVDT
jgi:hypothetical protein